MSDINTFKRQMTAITDRWATSMASISLRLGEIDERLALLAADTASIAEGSEERERLEAERNRLRAQAERVSLQLRLESLAIAPPTKADDKDLKKLPAWLRKIIRLKNIPLGNGVTLSPEIKFDIKHLRPNYIGVKIRW